MKRYVGILAGGAGTRLWPLSTKKRPKQFIPFINNKSLLQLTVERLLPSKSDIFVITGDSLLSQVQECVGKDLSFILSEPCGRNTAPAILFACMQVYNKDPESIIAFFPSDHFIPDVNHFNAVINDIVSYVGQHEVIVTLGLQPTYPATGYGYIQAVDLPAGANNRFYPAEKFHEKPTLELAKSYVEHKGMYWNAGMFIAQTSVILAEFKQYAPELFEQMQNYLQGRLDYLQLQNISFDHAVMEKSSKIQVVPVSFEWFDVGNIATFLKVKNKYEEQNVQIINIEAENNKAFTNKKIVAFLGVKNICIIESEDVLLVASESEVEKVKDIANQFVDRL